MSTKRPKSGVPEPAESSDADQLLEQSVHLLGPLIELLMKQGVGYPSLTKALRTAFVDAARRQLSREGSNATDAAISLRSGVHRKEVKALNQTERDDQRRQPERALSIAEQVFTRWTTDAKYKDKHGRPDVLALSGPAPSFDSLVSSVTRDFSRRTLLDELVRIGLAQVEDDHVVALANHMVPTKALAELAQLFGDSLHDHMAAGTANILAAQQDKPAPFLEHSMYANGLSDLSVEQLSALATSVWKPAFNQMVGAATQRYELDRDNNHRGRLRFGVYLYSESDDSPATVPKPAKKKARKLSKKTDGSKKGARKQKTGGKQ